MALDYGTKRVGVAVTDTLQMIANGLDTVHPLDLFPFLEKYFAKEKVDGLVVGKPMQMNNEAPEIENHIRGFVRKFQSTFPTIPVIRIDERFTSKMASQTMLESGINKKNRQNKELVDKISATIILQTYLEQKAFQK